MRVSEQFPSPVGGWSYPRPQLRREAWTSLDGEWKIFLDTEGVFRNSNRLPTEGWTSIKVPFSPESQMSGLHETGYFEGAWYTREFECAPSDQRTILHFGAVDFRAEVWINGIYVGAHEGGYTPFSFEISHALKPDGSQKILVHSEDSPMDLAKPRGKQDWEKEPHSIWYPRTSGIWQTVWYERISKTHIQTLFWEPHLERWEIGFEAFLRQERNDQNLWLRLRLVSDGRLLADDRFAVVASEVHRRIAFSDPGIDDYRNKLLWSPERPNLIWADIQVEDEQGNVLDRVQSYTALRSVTTQRDRFVLNGRPYYLRLILDQGYWPDSLMTPPSLDALERDIRLTKSMGFNGVRKHQKIEDPRYLFLADLIGLVVWEEMPSAYRFTLRSVDRITREWKQVLMRDINHPCIIVWVPFNESWGVPDLHESEPHQHYVQALYHLTKTLDPMRPVVGNDGWEASGTDIIGIHDYDGSPERMLRRYGSDRPLGEFLQRGRPAGRVLTLDQYPHKGQPIILTEFGGISITDPKPKLWGYSFSENSVAFEEHFRKIIEAISSSEILAGYCYTQLTDTFQENNGLLNAERQPKFPLDRIFNITHGPVSKKDEYAPVTTIPDEPEPPLGPG
jgi:beta-galactosidase/beta-glucuronidase